MKTRDRELRRRRARRRKTKLLKTRLKAANDNKTKARLNERLKRVNTYLRET